MGKNVAYGSTMTGDISSFAKSLPIHDVSLSFTVDNGFNFQDQSDFRVLHQVEPPEVLDITEKIILNHNFYDLILTWNEEVLNACHNAVFLPEGVCSWIDRKRPENPVYTECDTSKKEFAVSFLTSSKGFCPGHQLRLEIYERIPSEVAGIRIHKHMSPPRIDDKREILEPFQFHIAPENSMHNNWFADKIVDCFVAKTIPLYWGCPNLEKYFNMDGVIRFNNYEELIARISELTPDTYQSKLKAVEENYKESLKYVHTWTRIEEEIAKGIEKKQKLDLQHDNQERLNLVVRPFNSLRPLCRSL